VVTAAEICFVQMDQYQFRLRNIDAVLVLRPGFLDGNFGILLIRLPSGQRPSALVTGTEVPSPRSFVSHARVEWNILLRSKRRCRLQTTGYITGSKKGGCPFHFQDILFPLHSHTAISPF